MPKEKSPFRFSIHLRRAARLLALNTLFFLIFHGSLYLVGLNDCRVWLLRGVVGCHVVFCISIILAIVGLFAARRSEDFWLNAWASLLLIASNSLLAFLGLWVPSLFVVAGRPLRRSGRIQLPPVEHGDAWAQISFALEIPADIRDALAERWRWNGRTEHASVAAFAQLTLDLMAVGAPPALISAANRDAQDEIRHAELCFSLARAIDGRSESPGAFPEARPSRALPKTRTDALARLAVDSLVEGALQEGVSASVLSQLAKRCSEPTIRAVLVELAADEGRHAAHGWDIVEWCLDQGGELVASALRDAIETLPSEVDFNQPEAARFGGWERHGIQGMSLQREELARIRASIVRRVQALSEVRHVA